MSRDKQIEEMTEFLVNIQHNFDDYCAKPCRECELGGVFNCESYYKATELYDKGYRKASEVAREIFDEVLGFFNEKYKSVTTDCHYELLYNPIETPERMRNLGKAEMLKYLGDKIAELKKKYTE